MSVFNRTFVLNPASGTAYQYSHAPTSDLTLGGDPSIAASGVSVEVDVGFTLSKVKAFFMAADQNVTVYTNAPASGAPQDTIPLTANQEKYWDVDSLGTMSLLFAGNVTKMYVSNPNSVASTFSVRVLYSRS